MRAIRGAVCLIADDPVEMREAVGELLTAMLERNGLSTEDVVSVILTSTPDLTSAFPAAGARAVGFAEVPLLCAQEIGVEGSLERVVRILIHANTDKPRSGIQHVYLRGAEVLRADLHT